MNTDITLLDYFAAKAMQAFITREDADIDIEHWDHSHMVKVSYQIAYLMLKERAK